MKLSLNPHHLKRYKDILYLFLKYSSSDLAKDVAASNFWKDEEAPAVLENPQAQELAEDLERMGPTFVKIGQLLSSRADLLPEAYLRALARLQDKGKPFPYAEAEKLIESELGVRISKAFSRFDPEPIAGASLGQVHTAALRDGFEVVVKVQRPGVVEQVTEDFEVLAQIASFLDKHTEIGRRHRFCEIVEELRISIMHELNYEREAQSLVAMGRNLAEFDLVVIPQPIMDFSTKKVLTMEKIEGMKITKLSPIARLEMDNLAVAEQLF